MAGEMQVRSTIQVHSITECMELSTILYKGIGKTKYDCPEKVFAVILAGFEVGLSPTQALASIMLLDGKPSIYGDAGLALVRSSGHLAKIEEYQEGEGEHRHAVCKITRKGEQERTFMFSIADANRAGLIEKAKGKEGKSNGNWIAYPDRMLLARARGFALKDVFPDVLRGLNTIEEALDSIQTAEVKVTGYSTNSPGAVSVDSTKTEVVSTPTPIALPAALPSDQDRPITQDQLIEIGKIRDMAMAGKAITDPQAIKTEWEQILAPFKISSVRGLTSVAASELIVELGKKFDPFTHPDSMGSKT